MIAMKQMIATVSLSAVLIWCASAFTYPVVAQESHVDWVQRSLREMRTIKVGSTRTQLMKIFTWRNGTQLGDRTKQTFAYRGCDHFMVDVQFKPVGTLKKGQLFGPNDRIIKISRLYLDEAAMNYGPN